MNKRQEQEQRRDFALVRAFIVEGLGPKEICARFDCDRDEFEELLGKFYEAEIGDIRSRSTERVYTDYVLAQSRNVCDLTELIGTLDTAKLGGTKVSAIRARAEIYDRIIAKGQEFGFIEKRPEAKIVAGVLVEKMTNDGLRAAITNELAHLGKLMSRYGEKNILDVDPGPLHRAAPALPVGGSREHPRARNRVHGGRRVVKDPPS